MKPEQMTPDAKELLRDVLDIISKGLAGRHARMAFRDMTDAMRNGFTGSVQVHFHKGHPNGWNRTVGGGYV